MKYETVSINQADGIILCSDFNFGERLYTKGHQISAEDIPYFKKYNVNTVYGCFFENGDVEYKTALKQIAAQICGENIGYGVDNDGICRFSALHDGVFMIEETRIDKFNTFKLFNRDNL